jgi:hypothetical protein
MNTAFEAKAHTLLDPAVRAGHRLAFWPAEKRGESGTIQGSAGDAEENPRVWWLRVASAEALGGLLVAIRVNPALWFHVDPDALVVLRAVTR